MKRATQQIAFGVMVGILALTMSSLALGTSETNPAQAGKKAKISGMIVSRDAESFVLRDSRGAEMLVRISGATVIQEKKSNPFRGARIYTQEQLVRGLAVEVEGLGDPSGALAARDVRFTQDAYLVAKSLESRVSPVEGRLSETETRLTRSEENARHLSGEIQELSSASSAARDGAKTARETADRAIAGVSAANERIDSVGKAANARISAVDDYEVKDSAVIRFKLGSAQLSQEARTQLNQMAVKAQGQKGYLVEVTGFASADGDEAFNRILSQRRADAVVQYLADQMVPLRRIVTPFGFGTRMPVADNGTRPGRVENRRVEVKILVSKGLAFEESLGMASNKGK